MTISESFFSKKVDAITKIDLENYFRTNRKEGINIEYKSYEDSDREKGTRNERDKRTYNKIFETILAFLNTNGGLLIWGAPAGNVLEGEKEESYSLPLTEVPFKIEPDSFFNKIATDISPIPIGISYHSIELSKGHFCYLFEVNKSETTPHQFKGTYYIRVGSSTHTAPHSLVEAMIKRISFPKLEGYMTFGTSVYVRDYIIIPSSIIIYNESNFIQEKNLELRLVAHGCDFRELSSTNTTPFNSGCDFTINAKSILHKSVPYLKELLLIIPRKFSLGHETHIQILLSFWGERSPAIACNYNLFVKVVDIGRYEVSVNIEKKENRLMYEIKDEIARRGTTPSLEIVHNQVLESLGNRLRNSIFFNNIPK